MSSKKRVSGFIYDEASKHDFFNYLMFKRLNLSMEKAPSKASRCYVCFGQIPKGTPRLFYNEVSRYKKIEKNGMKYPLRVKKCICFRCAGKTFEEKRAEIKKDLKYLSLLYKKFKRVMKRKTIRKKIESALMLEKLGEEDTRVRRFVQDDWKKRWDWDKPSPSI